MALSSSFERSLSVEYRPPKVKKSPPGTTQHRHTNLQDDIVALDHARNHQTQHLHLVLHLVVSEIALLKTPGRGYSPRPLPTSSVEVKVVSCSFKYHWITSLRLTPGNDSATKTRNVFVQLFTPLHPETLALRDSASSSCWRIKCTISLVMRMYFSNVMERLAGTAGCGALSVVDCNSVGG